MARDDLIEQIANASDLQALESLRVQLLGKSGEITTKLKSLGSMDADARAAEAPKIHALREQVTAAIADRKAALEGLAVIAAVRHNHTDYDELLMQGAGRAHARQTVREQIEELVEKWTAKSSRSAGNS